MVDAEEFGHLVVEKAPTRPVGLDPFSVDDKLRNGALADIGEDQVGGAGGGLDVDLLEGNVMRGEETLRFAAVAAPGR